MSETTNLEALLRQAIDTSYKKLTEEQYEAVCVITNQVLKISPDHPQALHLLGIALHALKNYETAKVYLEKLYEIEPENYENINNLALTLTSLGDHQRSIELLEKAIQFKKDLPSLYNNLALSYRQIENYEKAIECLNICLNFGPEPKTYGLIGGCYGELKNLKKAKEYFKKALELDPTYSPARVDLSSVYHLEGDLVAGFREYECRFEVYDQLKFWTRIFDQQKKWRGENLDGKTILVHTEQGIGDSIHFIRYLSLLRKWKVKIILHCSKVLCPLFSQFADEVFTEDPRKLDEKANEFQAPEHDYHCSMISLPHLLNNPPIPKPPYLNFTEKLDMDSYDGMFKIGIVWAGNPQHPNDKQRSVSLRMFEKIHNLAGVKLFSLMKDTRARVYRPNEPVVDLTEGAEHLRVVDMSSHMEDFAGTARIINSMDLVIGVDTSVIHLAGALAAPTICAVAWNPDWRWTLEGDSTVWYPTIKLVRQKKKGDWQGVFDEIYDLVQKKIGRTE